MIPLIPNTGLLFGAALVINLLTVWLMSKQGRYFFTKDPVRRKFSMMEMEFPAKSFELENLINGIYKLPEAEKTVKAVKAQLRLDYLLYIPTAYGGIFLLCMYIAHRLHTNIGLLWFACLGWGQLVSFVLDYIENTYFWIMVGKKDHFVPAPDPSKPEIVSAAFKRMRVLELFKWGFPLVGMVCCLSVLAYYWLSGQF